MERLSPSPIFRTVQAPSHIARNTKPNYHPSRTLSRHTMLSRSLCLSLLALCAQPVYAQSFTESLQRAMLSDPEYLQAQTGLAASHARLDQSISANRPQLSASTSVQGNRRNYETLNSPLPPSEQSYRSNNAQIDLNQSLWRPANNAAIEQSNALLNQARAQTDQASQTLIMRLATAWLDAMAARDSVQFAEFQEDALSSQVQALARGVQLGYRPPPALDEVSARHRIAVFDLHASRNEFQSKLVALELITGEARRDPLPKLAGLPVDFDITRAISASTIEELTRENPAVVGAGQALLAAQAEIKKQRAGHLPTVDFFSSVGRNRNPAGNNPSESGFDNTTYSLGVRLNMPIFSGGGTQAKIAEAVALKEKARLEQDTARRTALTTMRQAWLGWSTARQRIQATDHAVTAMRAMLASTEAGRLKGTQTDADVLHTKAQLAGYERDYQKSLYEQITHYLKMKAALGQLTLEDAGLLDKALYGERQPEPAPAPQNASAS